MKRHFFLAIILAVSLLVIWMEGASAAFCPDPKAIMADSGTDRWSSEEDPGWKSTYRISDYDSSKLTEFSSAVAYGGDIDFPFLAACVYKLADGHVVSIEPKNKELPVDRTKASSGYWAPVKDYGYNHIMYMCKDGRTACKFRLVNAVTALP